MKTTLPSYRRQSGFTLIELLVAATIMALLTVIAVVSFSSTNKRARDAKRIADLNQVRAALEVYKSDTAISNGVYFNIVGGDPFVSFTSAVGTLISNGYLSNPAPVDPKNTGSQKYSYWVGTSGDNKTYFVCVPVENTTLGNNNSGVGTAPAGPPATFYCVQNP